ncbi:MAG: N-acetylmuramoyl-L-alanine amidase [Opitutaceae bacterium]|nr:N-acetylmuramoyl-L-alanine amidase [Opitutaceae bacterium]
MARFLPALRRVVLFVLCCRLASPGAAAVPPNSEGAGEPRRAPLVAAVEAAVRQRLAEGLPGAGTVGALGAQAPVELTRASLDGDRLTLAFNRGLLAFEPGSLAFEAASHAIHEAVGTVLDPVFSHYQVYTVIDGVPLHLLLNALDRSTESHLQGIDPSPPALPRSAGLNARRVAVSPGHGYYLNASSAWVLQRSPFFGIVEDFINHDLVTLLDEELRTAGAIVLPTRELNRLAGAGESGFPRWQEAARYHVKALGADPSVWNESGFTHLEQDIRCRPRYANAVNADVLVSLHNNGGGGTGTETLYDTNNTVAAESKRLADTLHAAVITAIRRDFNAAWPDRRVKGFNGSYGENRLATRPAVIIELAFMDKQSPDNDALQVEAFRRLVARAIREGLREFFDGPLTPPNGPSGLQATSDASGIDLSWTDNANNEDGLRVERRLEGTDAWTILVTLAAGAQSHRDSTAAPATRYDYRVQAFNAAGDAAAASNEVTAARAPASTSLSLISDSIESSLVRDWLQTATFGFRVVDGTGAPVLGATLEVSDGLLNRQASVTSVTADALGRVSYDSVVPTGQADGAYALTFEATKSGYTRSPGVTRTVQVAHTDSSAGAPRLVTQPASRVVTAGSEATLVVSASGTAPLTYQWQRDGLAVPGATSATLTLPTVAAADAGRYRVVVTNPAGTATSLEAVLTVGPRAWLSNVSVRTTLAASQTVIVGFVISGGGKPLLVRAAGPSLAGFGLATAMPDPRLVLYRDTTRVAGNNDWASALTSTMTAVGAFPFPSASRDSALLQTLSGAHTVHATGTSPGVVLIEGYDAGSGNIARLVNLSARNQVGTGADILITGFVVAGAGSQRLLIRAVGPSLTALGVPNALANPRLEVLDGATRIDENDDWAPALATAFAQVGAFALPAGSRDSALVVTLPAGRSYTAQVSGVDNTTGEALVEVYELPAPPQ